MEVEGHLALCGRGLVDDGREYRPVSLHLAQFNAARRVCGLLPTPASQQVQRAQQAARSQAEGNRYSVALELQADCYAGVWARNASAVSGGQVALEPGDLEEGMKTAQAIGDDTLQRRGGGRVSPESFTHGSSAQRVEWLQRGYQTGDPASCDTFKGL